MDFIFELQANESIVDNSSFENDENLKHGTDKIQ